MELEKSEITMVIDGHTLTVENIIDALADGDIPPAEAVQWITKLASHHAELVRQDERAACAEICKQLSHQSGDANDCEYAIRTRT